MEVLDASCRDCECDRPTCGADSRGIAFACCGPLVLCSRPKRCKLGLSSFETYHLHAACRNAVTSISAEFRTLSQNIFPAVAISYTLLSQTGLLFLPLAFVRTFELCRFACSPVVQLICRELHLLVTDSGRDLGEWDCAAAGAPDGESAVLGAAPGDTVTKLLLVAESEVGRLIGKVSDTQPALTAA
eukprot:4406533-Pleurochrysis_carterae.AAC.2